MRRGRGAVAVALALALLLTGCQGGPSGNDVAIADFVGVEGVPACRTWPVELEGHTYWELEPSGVDEWIDTHADPYGGTPQPQASASWSDADGGTGMLYRYEDGTALFIAVTGNRIYFTDEERTFDAVC